MSNRIVLVDREEVGPTIEGCDFGGRTIVLARSPEAVLLWVCGHSASINGHQRYHGPVMYLLWGRERREHGVLYRRVCTDQRLTAALIREVAPKIQRYFDGEVQNGILLGLKSPRRTVIVEGGGGVLRPSHRLGRDAHDRWMMLPASDRGFFAGGER